MVQPLPVSYYRDLGKLYVKKRQFRDPARSDLRPVYAIDVETYKGNVFLIADSDGRYLDKITTDSVLDFLFCRKYEGSWNFAFNLGYDGEVILKLLGNKLLSYRKTRKLSFKHGDYVIAYIPNKYLKIAKGNHSVVFFDIAQFFGSSLADAYQKNIGQLDQEYLDFKQKRKQFSSTFYRRNTTKVREYCIKDCQLTKALAEKWVKLFHDAFGFYPKRWVSSGYLAEKVMINGGVFLPRFDSIPHPVQNLALRSYYGGRFEIIVRGYIGEAYLYDINSAYPVAIANLPDLTDGKWIASRSIHPKAALGFFKIKVNIPDIKHIPPFPFRTRRGLLFPSGKFITYVTLDELRACETPRYYKILESWQYIPNRPDFFPYKPFINGLYERRLALKKANNPMQLPVKVILNSIYGKTGQQVNHIIGNLFNPVIFSYITGYTRARLYRFVVKNNLENEVVSFATDSICTTRKLDINSEKMGKFSLSNFGRDVYYLQNGIYRFNGKWKQRGFGKLNGKDIEHLGTVERNGRLYYKLKVMRNTKLRSSIVRDTLDDIGIIKQVTREINLNADWKRFWLNALKSIDEKVRNDSAAISLNYFSA